MLQRIGIWLLSGLVGLTLGVHAAAQTEECPHLGSTADLKSVCQGIDHDGLRRTFRVYRPAGTLRAVVFVLHGAGGSGAAQERIDGGSFARMAARERFLLVFPDGLGRQWNDGRGARRGEVVDDVGYLTNLLAHLRGAHALPSAPAYVAGMSNGGMMAFRLACEASDRFAAVAAVVANLSERLARDCKPSRALPLIVINGTADPLMPFDGGEVGFGRFVWARVLSTADTITHWVRQDGCTGSPVAESWRGEDGIAIVTEQHHKCRDGTGVMLVRVEGGGHAWPGGLQYLPELVIGRTARGIDASEAIWTFFRGYAARRS